MFSVRYQVLYLSPNCDVTGKLHVVWSVSKTSQHSTVNDLTDMSVHCTRTFTNVYVLMRRYSKMHSYKRACHSRSSSLRAKFLKIRNMVSPTSSRIEISIDGRWNMNVNVSTNEYVINGKISIEKFRKLKRRKL